MIVKVPICGPCAAKLSAILHADGEPEMIRRMGETLCERCIAMIPNRPPGSGRPRFELKRRGVS